MMNYECFKEAMKENILTYMSDEYKNATPVIILQKGLQMQSA